MPCGGKLNMRKRKNTVFVVSAVKGFTQLAVDERDLQADPNHKIPASPHPAGLCGYRGKII
jgi:hypothetical protein